MAARSLRSAALYRRLAADVSTLGLSAGPAWPPPVTEAQLGGLPGAAQRYLRFMGVVGRPADWSFLAHVTGRFRLRPGLPWMRCQAWQYNNGRWQPGRGAAIWHLLWIAHDEHGVYRGLYEWDGPDRAEYYARCLWRVLELVCVPGTIQYQVLPGLRRDELLSVRPGPHGTRTASSAAWWQVSGRS
jgi:hypothetical protein